MTEKSVNSVALARPPQRAWLRAFLLSGVVFGSGLIVGIVLTSTVLWHRTFNSFRQPPGFAVERLMNEIQDELLLSPDQSRQLKAIVSAHNERMKAIRDEVDPKIENELESLRKLVEGVLRPEQAKRWNARYDDMQRRFMRFGPPGAPPGLDHGRRPPGPLRDGTPFGPPSGPRPADSMKEGPPNGPRPPDGMLQGSPDGVQHGPRPPDGMEQGPPNGVPPGPPNGPRPPDEMQPGPPDAPRPPDGFQQGPPPPRPQGMNGPQRNDRRHPNEFPRPQGMRPPPPDGQRPPPPPDGQQPPPPPDGQQLPPPPSPERPAQPGSGL